MNKAYIFIGRSGCGKGTQAELLMGKLKEKGEISDKSPLFYMETGDGFRDLTAGTSHTSRLAKAIMEGGERQPDFLAVWMWSHRLIENLMGDEVIVFDGTPRSLNEAKMLDTAFKFYGVIDPVVINVDVSRDWARERLASRKRADDSGDGIEKRLDWYDKDVEPAVDFYAGNPLYKFIKVNGEQTIEKVHADILALLG